MEQPRRLSKTRKIWMGSGGGSLAVTLPSEICDLFGWRGGDEVSFLVNHDGRQLIIEKADPKASDQVKPGSEARGAA